MEIRKVRFEELPLRSFFLHNNVNYRKVDNRFAEKVYDAQKLWYFMPSQEVQPNN